MADISKIKSLDGNIYNVKDSTARSGVNNAVKGLSIYGQTLTVTKGDDSTSSITLPDNTINIDTSLSATSTNPVTNKAIVNGGATILNALGTGTAPSDNTYVVWTGASSATAGRVKLSYIWTWIANKLSSVMGISKTTFDAKVNTADVKSEFSRTDNNPINGRALGKALENYVSKIVIDGTTISVSYGENGTTNTFNIQEPAWRLGVGDDGYIYLYHYE